MKNVAHRVKLWWKTSRNMDRLSLPPSGGWQLVAVSVTWPFWTMCPQLEDESWDVEAGHLIKEKRRQEV